MFNVVIDIQRGTEKERMGEIIQIIKRTYLHNQQFSLFSKFLSKNQQMIII
jgi:hypothetical protein